MTKTNTDKLDGVTNAAVQKATGRNWDEWIRILRDAGAADWNHKEIVAFLAKNYELSGWWQQTVTVAYEKVTGRRIVGQTADTGFQVGVQKTIPVTRDEAWRLITSRSGIACWLGKVNRFSLVEGKRYATIAKISGEIRVVKNEQRIRLTWNRTDFMRPATLQIALAESAGGKTSLRFHMEHLPSAKVREEMKQHWKAVLEDLKEMCYG